MGGQRNRKNDNKQGNNPKDNKRKSNNSPIDGKSKKSKVERKKDEKHTDTPIKTPDKTPKQKSSSEKERSSEEGKSSNKRKRTKFTNERQTCRKNLQIEFNKDQRKVIASTSSKSGLSENNNAQIVYETVVTPINDEDEFPIEGVEKLKGATFSQDELMEDENECEVSLRIDEREFDEEGDPMEINRELSDSESDDEENDEEAKSNY